MTCHIVVAPLSLFFDSFRYFSANVFRLAKPVAKSPPIILSMLNRVPMSLET